MRQLRSIAKQLRFGRQVDAGQLQFEEMDETGESRPGSFKSARLATMMATTVASMSRRS